MDRKTWTAWAMLPATYGHHTVRVTFRDAGGNISAAYNDYIRLDAP